MLNGVGSLEVNLYALFIASPPELSSQPMNVGYQHGNVFVFVVVVGGTGVVAIGMLFFCWVSFPVVVCFQTDVVVCL